VTLRAGSSPMDWVASLDWWRRLNVIHISERRQGFAKRLSSLLIRDVQQVPPTDQCAGAGLHGLFPAIDQIALIFRQVSQ